MAPRSYRHPEYARLSGQMEKRFGLPDGLLRAVVTKGERSNADQVSEAGAKTVFQIIPATRKAAMEKFGIDAYLSAENAAEVAARLLKESLDRNGGDIREAVAEYHGGTDRTNWGPRTKAYVGRVASTFDRVKADRQAEADQAAPSIAKVYEAYKAGKLSPEERAEFEADVQSGAVLLPRGAAIDAKPKATVLPDGVVAAYNQQSEMTDQERDQLDADLREGLVALPPGQTLKRPARRSAAELLGMGARDVMEGAGGLVDIVAGPAGAVMDAVIPGDAIAPDPARTIMKGIADAAGLAEPATQQEKLVGAVVEGGTQGVLTAGAGGALAKTPGAIGTVARELAAAPATDIVASGVGAGAMEKARQEGAGPLAQLALGVAAGAPAGLATHGLARAAKRFGPKAARVVETTPREVLIDEAGALTEEGREVAARQGLKPEDVKGAYDEAAKPEPVGMKDLAPTEQEDVASALYTDLGGSKFGDAYEATRGDVPMEQEVREVLSTLGDVPLAQRVRPKVEEIEVPPERRTSGRLVSEYAAKDTEPPAVVVRRKPDGGYVLVEGGHRMRAAQASGRESIDAIDATELLDFDWPTYLAKGDASALPLGRPGATDTPLPASASARAADAASEGVSLTRGQATQDFAAQEAEQTLRAQATGEGEKARQFYAQQQEQIKAAAGRFQQAFGDTTANAAERGGLVKEALRELRDAGKAGVTALYDQARTVAEGMGEAGSNLIQLDTGPLLAAMREMFIDESVPEATRKALKQQAAKYGLIGEAPRTVEGETSVTLKDAEGQPAGKITFTGPQQRLTIVNAEDLRKKVNALYEAGKTNPQEALKGLIDDAVEQAVERAATEGKGGVGEAFKEARAAHRTQKQTFEAKDIVQKLIAWKKGTRTDEVLPENAIKAIFAGGPESLTNLKKVKALLLSTPTEQSKAAWKAIQAHGVADIFAQAIGPSGDISGARLNTAIKKFGTDKLKVLLAEEDFNQLMKLRRIIGDATIPLAGTTNPSGSGYKVINFLAQQGMRLASVAKIVPGVGPIVDTAAGLVKTGREAAQAKRTLEGVTSFSEVAAAKADATSANGDPLAFVRKFLSVAGSDEIIAPVMAAAANEERP